MIGRKVAIPSPADGPRFFAVDGVAVVHPRASRGRLLAWSPDGALPETGGAAPERLVPAPGSHELRCAAAAGESEAVRVSVR